jgi:putative LysE/RhtB family amino acid efflux pump
VGESFELFLRTVVIGVVVAAPVGAMALLSIQRTLAHGWAAGMTTGAGIATADAVFAGVAAFGVAALAEALVAWQVPLRIAGGVGLLWLGWRAFRSRPAETSGETAVAAAKSGRLYTSAVALTLTNPMTIMAFAAVFAGAGLVVQPGAVNAAVATAGVAAGSLMWWLMLVSGVWAVRHALSERAIEVIDHVSGAVLMVFGVLSIAAGIGAAI